MIEQTITEQIPLILQELFGVSLPEVQIQKTSKDFAGDMTVVVFPMTKISRKSPEETGRLVGELLVQRVPEIASFNVVKGFLNLQLSDRYFLDFFNAARCQENFGMKPKSGGPYVVEFSSPNTNKPLHLGHIRNNLLGWSVCEILSANGHDVVKVNLVNDRGIHICKSMLAWQRFGQGETPETSGIKGDHLVGKYYVIFDKTFKAEIQNLIEQGMSQEEAEKQAPILLQAQEMLRQWEAGDPQVIQLWKTMNAWVYDGFKETYRRMGIAFDKIYYESETYLLGKEIALQGLKDGHLYRREDGSVWADLRDEGLDEKLLLRKDGTSVYMTQDLGTAKLRHDAYKADKMVYVVGNEQNYHFDVLKRVLLRLGYDWAQNIHHLSYGMVELPEGKMKSREGTVVDADDLMETMVETARRMTEELGKTEQFDSQESQQLYETIALGALKYFILKVDPVKSMLFNPRESIDFNGNTGPFIQYTYARICSLIKRSGHSKIPGPMVLDVLPAKERQILRVLHEFPSIVEQAAEQLSPAMIANYVYELAKEFNSFYQDTPILKESNEDLRLFRISLSAFTASVIERALRLLGIGAPDRM